MTERVLYITWTHDRDGGAFRCLHPEADQILDVPEFGWSLARENIDHRLFKLLRRLLPGVPRGWSSILRMVVRDDEVPDRLIDPARASLYEAHLTGADPFPNASPTGKKRTWYYALGGIPEWFDADREGPWDELSVVLKCIEQQDHDWIHDSYWGDNRCQVCGILETKPAWG